MNRPSVSVGLSVLAFLLAACGQTDIPPTTTSLPVPTSTSTITAIPATATTAPPTPTPTNTPTPTTTLDFELSQISPLIDGLPFGEIKPEDQNSIRQIDNVIVVGGSSFSEWLSDQVYLPSFKTFVIHAIVPPTPVWEQIDFGQGDFGDVVLLKYVDENGQWCDLPLLIRVTGPQAGLANLSGEDINHPQHGVRQMSLSDFTNKILTSGARGRSVLVVGSGDAPGTLSDQPFLNIDAIFFASDA